MKCILRIKMNKYNKENVLFWDFVPVWIKLNIKIQNQNAEFKNPLQFLLHFIAFTRLHWNLATFLNLKFSVFLLFPPSPSMVHRQTSPASRMLSSFTFTLTTWTSFIFLWDFHHHRRCIVVSPSNVAHCILGQVVALAFARTDWSLTWA